MKIGLIADIHGDLKGFQKALTILDEQSVERILCAGDIVDRGADADTIVKLIQERDIVCIRGNHEHSVAYFQEKWRDNPEEKQERLKKLGRIISNETLNFLLSLPDTHSITLHEKRILMAHGAPWSDVLALYPDSRPAWFERLNQDYGNDYDILILGHTHQPMQVKTDHLWIFNPGSIYGVTGRDSHTCGVLTLPNCDFQIFNLRDGQAMDIPVVER